ncbi:secreted RxLR effector peptide protein, putative [Phytophthora infestans T30-4]|uniref:RxLR effector protein PexRD18 n=1 Tax=Phytophthora infestans (strain T30-4) TaxID=403677 RepID=RD18_PHYIT|nr:secreted RxLR effector peptide protein, putative [Phytophthora infestans T30-4]D0N4Y1.1 RecName: Full=RxLR effector protein PexRD18; Flags: Precursor [Phytophthora infestans T30-4]EEY69939.1 secreted RxLR effector peptide protein, putative [Phytophthora infestans T30-4]|eukprot:XP_002998586.1 secreted RxLR effector peptide protein, putative [Phytophthora infestans T30-4]
MSHQRILLLLMAAFFAWVSAQTPPGQADKSKLIAHDVLMKTTSLSETTIATSSKRFLRLYDAEVRDTVRGDNDVDREERGTTPLLSKVDDLIHKVFKSNPEQAQIKAWMKSRVHPQAIFDTLRLAKSTTKLNDDPNLLLWLKLVAAFRAKNGNQAFSDLDLYYLLLKRSSGEELKILIESFRKTGALKELGKSMQKSLSGSWVSKTLQHETDPKIVYDTLRLQEAGTKLVDSPIFHQWLAYAQQYRAQKGNHWFGDDDMLDLFRKTMPEKDVVTLLHLLRNVPGMKDHGDTMQRFLFLSSKTSRKMMHDVWLNYDVTPEQVFKILRLVKVNMDAVDTNAMFIHWLRYVNLYRSHTKKNVLSSVQMVHFLADTKPLRSEWQFATFFESLKDVPDLKRLAENMQTYLFQNWLHTEWDPKAVSSMLAIPFPTSAVYLPKNDPIYKTWVAYTLYYTERKGGVSLLNKVKTLLDNDNPIGALTAAMKAQ